MDRCGPACFGFGLVNPWPDVPSRRMEAQGSSRAACRASAGLHSNDTSSAVVCDAVSRAPRPLATAVCCFRRGSKMRTDKRLAANFCRARIGARRTPRSVCQAGWYAAGFSRLGWEIGGR